tara:strand:- start:368 stop:1480 length:1113 start_codon:yes stop_codon:yes gene_type:complete
VAHTNPIVLDSAGRIASGNNAWVLTGDVKVILHDSADVLIFTQDDYVAQGDTSTEGDGEWISSDLVPTRTANTIFTLPGNNTALFHVGRRLKLVDSTTVYATITVSAYTTLTTLTVVVDGGTALTASLASLSYSLLSYANPSNPYVGKSIVYHLTTSGTYTKPLVGLKQLEMWVQGGGGAGGGASATSSAEAAAGGGGGAGGMTYHIVDADDLAATETYTIGAGGTGASDSVGGTGGATTFALAGGTNVVGSGGVGGTGGADLNYLRTNAGGGGGGGSGGTKLFWGGPGSRGISWGTLDNASARATAGGGGTSYFGGGRASATASTTDSLTGTAAIGTNGSGGSGSRSTNAGAGTGGAGSPGIIMLIERY